MSSPRAALLSILLLSACTSVEITPHVPRDVAGESAPQAPQPTPASRTAPTLATPSSPPRPATPAPTVSIPRQAPVPQGPFPVTSCDAGGCWSNGNRYDGAGGTYLDRSGKLCQGNGTWMQCF